LLGELFVFADRPISLSELARRAGTSMGGAHKEVERLESAGLVRSTRAGRSRLIEADPSSPVYMELRGLLLKALGPEPLLRSALAEVEGIEGAFIYGSWADPAERSPADIDLLVIGEPDVGEVYDAASAVEVKVGRPVNVTVRSPTEWAEADGAFERAVRSGPRIDLR
jgi:predicted nucleotidyltransferase